MHNGQVVELVHLGNVDAYGAGLAVPAVDALAEVGMRGRCGQRVGEVAFLGRGGYVLLGNRRIPRCS